MPKDRRSFFERLTGSIAIDTDANNGLEFEDRDPDEEPEEETGPELLEEDVGQLAVDMFETPAEIVIQAMVAGVKPEDLNVSISREMVTIKGARLRPQNIPDENYFNQELYWGSFSRTLVLPNEIEVEEVEAVEKHGLLTLRLPKIDKQRIQKVKIKTI